ncbi:GTP 3',8-cyclase MoaA [Aminithiophilus ramosus]|uniref:GTP 3',8-cyclase n=2 Tax=Synergistales TaxID=649776 RepID=A0A9Q7AIL6_9BACT|nr:GTP 3',8-cyclase MoaA [Aminithiophilus ramosus]QTX33544.1 GTP 3',8-cyclase MoaA [Aminithiophilus ramosus]QVL37399.1 GTP 3',8-cyclase MoaA [Synergistota bacterium]
MDLLKDRLGREISYVRISLTDRCNFRCVYCMPEEGVPFIDHDLIMTYEEILYLCEIFRDVGIKKIRFTGGEPFVRKGMIAFLKEAQNRLDGVNIALSTNGSFLMETAHEINKISLKSINISLDTLDNYKFQKITRYGDLDVVKKGIIYFSKISQIPIKLNCVLIRGFNDQEMPELISFAREYGLILRFIEFMPLDKDVWDEGGFISSDEIVERLKFYDNWVLQEEKANYFDGPAKYYVNHRYNQKIGVISAVSHHFCSSCNRLRVTALGELKPCLFSDEVIPLRDYIRNRNYNEIIKSIHRSINLKPVCWKNLNKSGKHMSQIGG